MPVFTYVRACGIHYSEQRPEAAFRGLIHCRSLLMPFPCLAYRRSGPHSHDDTEALVMSNVAFEEIASMSSPHKARARPCMVPALSKSSRDAATEG